MAAAHPTRPTSAAHVRALSGPRSRSVARRYAARPARASPYYSAAGAALSSASVEWYTPPHVLQAVLKALRREQFDLDPCAPRGGGRVPATATFDADADGLAQPWAGLVFVNPPYGRKVTRKWVERCRRAAGEEGATVVALLPARTGTAWWFDNVFRAGAHVLFLQGRLKFGDGSTPAPFDSALVAWGMPPRDAAALALAFPSGHLCKACKLRRATVQPGKRGRGRQAAVSRRR